MCLSESQLQPRTGKSNQPELLGTCLPLQNWIPTGCRIRVLDCLAVRGRVPKPLLQCPAPPAAGKLVGLSLKIAPRVGEWGKTKKGLFEFQELTPELCLGQRPFGSSRKHPEYTWLKKTGHSLLHVAMGSGSGCLNHTPKFLPSHLKSVRSRASGS